MSDRYNVVFQGHILPGFELETVKQAFVARFKVPDDKISAYFSGKRIFLKKDTEHKVAYQYKDALEKLGASVLLERIAPAPSQSFSELSLVPMEGAVEEPEQQQALQAPKAPSPTTADNSLFKCPKCQFQQEKGNFCVQCGIVFEKYAKRIENFSANTLETQPRFNSNVEAESDSQEDSDGSLSAKSIILILGATLVGAFIWKMIAVVFDYELGLVAWGVGGLIGFAAVSSGSRGNTVAIFCGAMAICSIVTGKYWAYDTLREQMFDLNNAEISQELGYAFQQEKANAEEYKNLVVDEKSKREFMVDYGYSEASDASEVSNEELAQFDQNDAPRLRGLSSDQATYSDWLNNGVQAQMNDITTLDLLKDSFSIIDILFLFLGVGTAYRMGRNE